MTEAVHGMGVVARDTTIVPIEESVAVLGEAFAEATANKHALVSR